MKAPVIRLFSAFAALAGGLSAAGPAATAAGSSATAWTLQAVNTGRTCNLKLRFDAAGAAGGLALPAGCRHAVPALRKASLWAMGPDAQIKFESDDRQNILTFNRQADGTWQATAVDGTALMLTATGPTDATEAVPPGADAAPLADATSAEPQATASSQDTKAAAAAVSAQDAAGRYAVLRGTRDTGCMVTLEAAARGSRAAARARLAPACRDQGITIFDPLSWHTKGGALVLTARKGHAISLEKDDTGVWVKMPKDVMALGLKPL